MPDMHTFWVLWTYSANYSNLMKIEARDEKDALERTGGFLNLNKNFKEKATLYVFSSPPVLIQHMGEVIDVDAYEKAPKYGG